MIVILNEGESAAHIDIAVELLPQFLALMPSSYRIVATVDSPRVGTARFMLASKHIAPGTLELMTSITFEMKAARPVAC